MTESLRVARRAARCLALLALSGALPACTEDEPPPEAPAAAAPSEEVPPPAPPVGLIPGSLAGTWWALCGELPHKGLRMTLEAPEADAPAGTLHGSWISFDWRNSGAERELARESRAVAIAARKEGDEWIVQGPAPQIDARGQPNGDRGRWELRVRRISLPGEPLPRYSGRLIHTELTSPDGVTVELTPRFRVHER